MNNCKAMQLVGFHWLERAGTINLPNGQIVRVKRCAHCEFRAYEPSLRELSKMPKAELIELKRESLQGKLNLI